MVEKKVDQMDMKKVPLLVARSAAEMAARWDYSRVAQMAKHWVGHLVDHWAEMMAVQSVLLKVGSSAHQKVRGLVRNSADTWVVLRVVHLAVCWVDLMVVSKALLLGEKKVDKRAGLMAGQKVVQKVALMGVKTVDQMGLQMDILRAWKKVVHWVLPTVDMMAD